jgi:spore coat polysaccharide biosynthesis protein SpsF
MRLGFLVTARLKSSRLPLKLLHDLNGRSVIERVLDRARQVRVCDELVLCTSDNPQDLPLIRSAQKEGISYYAGDPDDVLKRLLAACRLFELDGFVGITADNPVYSIYHANRVGDMLRREPKTDFVFTKGLPLGVNIYALGRKALETVCAVKEIVDTEIWGYLVNRPEIFNVRALEVEQEYQRDYRLTLDEPLDYALMQGLFSEFGPDTVPDLLQVYRVLDANPTLAGTNSAVVQRDLDEETKRRIEDFYVQQRAQVMSIKDDIYAN